MLPDPFVRALEEIRRDKRSGATALVRRGAEALARLGAAGSLEEAARALVAAQPMMAPMWNLANTLLHSVESGESTIAEAAGAFIERVDANTAAVIENAAGIVPDGAVVLTHSHSATVRDALIAAKISGLRFRAIATESRPMSEGVTLARELAEAGIEVTLIIDSAMLGGMERASLVLVGADSVSMRGLTNKTGTAMLADIARARNVPLYSACGSEKFLPLGCPEPKEPAKPAAEITAVSAPGLSVENYYFDRTPLDRFTGVVTEEGVLMSDEIRLRLGLMSPHTALR